MRAGTRAYRDHESAKYSESDSGRQQHHRRHHPESQQHQKHSDDERRRAPEHAVEKSGNVLNHMCHLFHKGGESKAHAHAAPLADGHFLATCAVNCRVPGASPYGTVLAVSTYRQNAERP